MTPTPGPGVLSQMVGQSWETIRSALDKNDRTARLCLILLVRGIATATPILVIALLHGHLG